MSFINQYKEKLHKLVKSEWGFNKLNTLFGCIIFFISLLTYYLTLEPTTSFWDCGEYIATAYKIQVGHPPGAPLFIILGNFFANLGFGTENVAFMINLMSAICSALTILFLFWSITLLMKKNFKNSLHETRVKYFIILSASIGSLVYTFSDSFWFSAVEGEVYAMSSLFTALVFWCILKWEDDFNSPRSSKWLVLISFLIGLSIGVHMLNLLAIPAITIIYCYKKNWLWSNATKTKKNQGKSSFYVFFISLLRFIIFNLLGVLILALIYRFLIPKIVDLSGIIEIYFVNSLNLPLNSGTIFFFLLLACIIIGLLVLSQRKKMVHLNTVTLSFLFFLIGYSLFFVLIIRSNANTPIDENNPEDAVSLLAYLNREQYGTQPLIWGEYFNSDNIPDFTCIHCEKRIDCDFNRACDEFDETISCDFKSGSGFVQEDGNPVYTRGYLVTMGLDTLECFSKECVNNYKELNKSNKEFKNIEVKKKYLISDKRKNQNTKYQNRKGEYYSCKCGNIKGIKYNGCDQTFILSKEYLEQNDYIISEGNEFNSQQICANPNCRTKIKHLIKERDIISTGFFPRMWSSQRGGYHIEPSWSNPSDNRPGYLDWAGISNCDDCYDQNNLITQYEKELNRAITKGECAEIEDCLIMFQEKCIKDCVKEGGYDKTYPRAITFSENLKFFKEYQIKHMYWRYFMWNFSGRQNDLQGHGGIMKGNWMTGINIIDNQILKLGPQHNIPSHIKNHKGRNTYFLLPLILGLIGCLFHLFRKKRDFWAVFLLFFFTGLAIAIELNQTPFQPRERDYAYVGSFYAFSIWIAFGALAILHFANWIKQKIKLKNLLIQKGALLIISFILLGIPTLMAIENWDDHDRSNRYTARDFAKNYLNSCEKDAILFNMGDNDTFPLWYVQEVEGERTDIRTVNLSLLNTDWYINQMRKDAYDGKGVPFSMDPHLYRQGGGGRDVAYSSDQLSGNIIPEKDLFSNEKDYQKAEQIYTENGGKRWSLSDFNSWIKSEESYTIALYPPGCQDDDCTRLKYFPNTEISIPVDKDIFEQKLEVLKNEIDTLIKQKDLLKVESDLKEELNNIENVIRKKETEMLSKEFELSIMEDEVVIYINDGVLTKTNLMILDMLEQNNWQRPIYFATTIGTPSSDNPDFLFLHEYLQLDGMVYKLAPIKNQTNQNGSFSPRINSDILYNNIMSFEWGGLDSKYDIYLDETNLRMIQNLKNIFTKLSTKLIEEKNYKKAKEVIKESFKKIPPEKVPLQDYDCTKYSNTEGSLIENYFKIITQEQTDSIKKTDFKKIVNYTNDILNRYSSEIKYYSSFPNQTLIENLDLKRSIFTAVNTISQIYKMRTDYNVPLDIIENEKNKLINKNVLGSLTQIELLISDNILSEASPLIINTYYYANDYEKANSLLSKWINNNKIDWMTKEELLQIAFNHNKKYGEKLIDSLIIEEDYTINNAIQERLLLISFENNHSRKEILLDSIFQINFNILKNQVENIQKDSFNIQNINTLSERVDRLFDVGTSGRLCLTIAQNPYGIYSGSKYTFLKIDFNDLYHELESWAINLQSEIIENYNSSLIGNIAGCACLEKFFNNRIEDRNDECLPALENLAILYDSAQVKGKVDDITQEKFDDLNLNCPDYFQQFIYLMNNPMTAQ